MSHFHTSLYDFFFSPNSRRYIMLFVLQYISLFPKGGVFFSHVLRGLFTSVLLIDCTHPNVLTLSHAGTWGFWTKSRLNCVPLEGKYKSDRKEGATGSANDRKWEEGGRPNGRKEGARGWRNTNKSRFTLGTSGNVIPISIEAPLWSYERERSHTVLLSSLSLVLCLNYLWKTSIEGMWWLKGFYTNNTKSKKALKWTKKCHISLRSCQKNANPATKGR